MPNRVKEFIAWTPVIFSGSAREAWWDLAANGAVTQSGGTLTQLNSQYSLGLNTRNLTGTASYNAGALNGYPTFTCNGTTHYLDHIWNSSRTIQATSGLCFLWVGSQISNSAFAGSGGRRIISTSAFTSDCLASGMAITLGEAASTSFNYVNYRGVLSGTNSNLRTGSTTQGTFDICALTTFNGTAKLWVNGVLEGTKTISTTGNIALRLVRISGSNDFGSVHGRSNYSYGEIVFLKGAISDDDIHRWTGYAAHKFGLQSRLASDYRYKNERPHVYITPFTA